MMKMRPFFQTLQNFPQSVYKHLSTKPSQPSKTPWQEFRRTWLPVLTPEQEETYLDVSEQKTEIEIPIVKKPEAPIEDESWVNSEPLTPVVSKIVSHIADKPEQFAVVSGPLLEARDGRISTHIRTKELPKPQAHITSKLRRGNTTDPYLSSVPMTPNHEFAIVPRRTAQLPLNEHKLSVFELVNAAIVTFHLEQRRLPHRITIAAIRYWQYRISLHTFDPDNFYYDDMPIPITGAPIGEFGIDEVRLD